MADPTRWKDGSSDAPDELKDLLSRATPSTDMGDAEHARVALRVATIGSVVGVSSLATAALKLTLVLATVTVTSVMLWPVEKPAHRARDLPRTHNRQQIAPSPSAPALIEPSQPALPGQATLGEAPESRRVTKPQPAKKNAESLAREAELLGAAHAGLAQRPALALERVKQHEREFPQGTLLAERELIRIEALLLLGRRKQAEARAKALLRKDAHSIYAPRVETLLKHVRF